MKKKFKLKLSERPVQGAHKFGQELLQCDLKIDMMGMSILAGIGRWVTERQFRLQGNKIAPNGNPRRTLQQVWLGFAIAAILVTAEKHSAIVTFNTMDNYISREVDAGTKKVDYALGIFLMAHSKWCISINCAQRPDTGINQQLLQLMLCAVGLMCYLSRLDPVVDCLLPFYETATKARTEGGSHGKATKKVDHRRGNKKH